MNAPYAGALAGLLFMASSAGAQLSSEPASKNSPNAEGSSSIPTLAAVRLDESLIQVDGYLDDACWGTAPVAQGFVQLQPNEGQAATERTEVRVLYGDDALYVAIHAFDSRPDSIVGQLTRRDQSSYSDRVHVLIDSYNDRRTAFHFAVNPKGVKQDYYRFDDTQEDGGWDAVWDVATQVVEDGWTAEFRLPYSQLRFGREQTQDWGINFIRDVARKNETSFWAPISTQENGMVSKFGRLEGLEDLSPPRRIEMQPYTLARITRAPGDPDNPFYKETAGFSTAGVDLKLGLTSNLTLDVTLNPDFGQVEADPAQLNLSAFETFQPERRPFFIEGSNIFQFGLGLGDGDGAAQSLFYSRRIGRNPQGSADERGGYSEETGNTTILGAWKLSGKTEGGLSIGVLHALTGQEKARVVTGEGDRIADVVEPSTNYAIARVQQDFRDGRSAIGVIGTGIIRNADVADQLDLHRRAFSGGLDFRHKFAGDNFQVSGYVLGSTVRGTPEAIAETQRAAGRYLQRPGAAHLTFDPARTSLGGMSAMASIAKIAGGFWRFSTGFQTRSPEFETNDIGFQQGADYTTEWIWVGYHRSLPTKYFRRWNVNLNGWTTQTYGGEKVSLGGNVNGSFQLHSYWGGYAGVGYNGQALSASLLRGGPAILTDPSINGWFGVSSDNRKAVQFNWGNFFSRRAQSDSWSVNTRPNVQWRPSGRANVSLGAFYDRRVEDRQWVTAFELAQSEYVFGRLDQKTVGLTGRLDFAFTSDLSLQLYAQPFISAGTYSGLKEVDDPKAARYGDRFRGIDAELVDGAYRSDLDGDGTRESFDNPDFNFKQFRSNAVLRWEYRPGSALFVVWSQSRDHSVEGDGRFDLNGNLGNLFSAPAENIFMVKLSYWLSP